MQAPISGARPLFGATADSIGPELDGRRPGGLVARRGRSSRRSFNRPRSRPDRLEETATPRSRPRRNAVCIVRDPARAPLLSWRGVLFTGERRLIG